MTYSFYLIRVFAYLKCHPNLCLLFDSRRLDVDNGVFRVADWGDFFPDADPLIPNSCPKSLGEAVKLTCYVDANHAGNMITRRSHTGFITFVNMVVKTSEYSRDKHVWIRVRRVENRYGANYIIAIQVEDDGYSG